MTWLLFLATVVVSMVVGGVDDDVVDYVLDDVGTDVVVVGASVILGSEDDDVAAFVSTVVVYDVDSGVVSAVEVGGVLDATVDDNVEFSSHLSIPRVKNTLVLFFVCLTKKVKCSVSIPGLKLDLLLKLVTLTS